VQCSDSTVLQLSVVLTAIWYLASIFVWCVVSTYVGNGALDRFAFALSAFFGIVWWLPYISWIALGEVYFFQTFPNRTWYFLPYALIGLVAFSSVAVAYNNQFAARSLIAAASVVTVVYVGKRFLRTVQET
jgi:hypothetical protein